ncbi:type II toxin-antitoxin system RelE/ParE family toxin [Herbaspirillum sp. alder98]|uniref:type II toxin-antitoxin system RelE/ParE family toxin n=1 Tax=Herbaspirillum sp. alder98 TaxID=2913096 RepID=UPI001CD8EFE6|nr:type II toxin-antitoxin system RelE/ParE family toxin [Herbaspirillum sp. alder98]MCA1325571.1 type II toxin-antitoxin system RelE/ParE family toxin [Herbaspirillum sp. alder98]
MAIIILPDALADLHSLQEYMLGKWTETDWLAAEDEIFEKLARVDAGSYPGTAINELAMVGNFDYQYVFTSHHKVVYRRVDENIHVYAVASNRQDFMTLLMKRLLKR